MTIPCERREIKVSEMPGALRKKPLTIYSFHRIGKDAVRCGNTCLRPYRPAHNPTGACMISGHLDTPEWTNCQYYPNKQSLLFALLEQHMEKVAEAMETACCKAQGKPLLEMLNEVMQRFLDAKLAGTDISTALYRISAEIW